MSASQVAPEPILQLSQSTIRPYCERDAEAIAKEANNPKIARWMTNRFPHPYTVANGKDWVTQAMSVSPPHSFAICLPDSGLAIGGIGIKPREDVSYITVEIGYWLGEGHWYRGIATEAVVAFSKWTFENFDHVIRIEAQVFEGNDASCRVLEKSGYTLEGRMRKAIKKNDTIMDLLVFCTFRPGY